MCNSIAIMRLFTEDLGRRVAGQPSREPLPETRSKPIPLEDIAPLIEWAAMAVEHDCGPQLAATYAALSKKLGLPRVRTISEDARPSSGRLVMLLIEDAREEVHLPDVSTP